MNPSEIISVLEERGAVLRGHFRLSSGRHSDVFVQKFRIFEHPKLTQRFGESIADMFAGSFDTVASPAVGAIVLGFATALAADCRSVFAERVDDGLEFRRGFTLRPHEKVLVVEDVVTTGGSARGRPLVKQTGATIVGVGVLLDRSDPDVNVDLGAPMKALTRLEASSWEETECPLCKKNVAITDPGSRRLL